MAKISPQSPSRKTVAGTALAAACAAALTSLAHPASLRVDGRGMSSDVPPVTTAKGAYLPLRAVAERLGATTTYDEKTGSIELIHRGDTMHLRVGDRAATLNGTKITLANAPFSVQGRAMVSLQVIRRALKTHVRYDTGHAQIDVMTGATDDPASDATRLQEGPAAR